MPRRRVPESAAEVVGVPADQLGEGPHWDAERGLLIRVDLYAGLVHSLEPEQGTQTTLDLGRPVGFAIPRTRGGLVLGVEHEVIVRDRNDRSHLLARLDPDLTTNRINDGKCDAAGRLWAGTLSRIRERGAASLYRVSPTGEVVRAQDALIMGNGLAWSPSGDRFYYVDSATQAIDVFAFDAAAGVVSARRTLTRVDPRDGMPDGLTVDADGGVWVALYRSGALHRYTPSGRLDTVVDLPVSCPTSVTFAGSDLRDLYVTTSRHRLSAAQASRDGLAGRLLRVSPGPQGLPAHSFAG